MREAMPLIRDGAIHGLCPSDGSALAPVTCTALADLPGIVTKSREAGERFAARPISERAEMLVNFGNAILARRAVRPFVVLADLSSVSGIAQARLAQITPPEERATLRAALLAQPPAQRGAWLQARLAQ